MPWSKLESEHCLWPDYQRQTKSIDMNSMIPMRSSVFNENFSQRVRAHSVFMITVRWYSLFFFAKCTECARCRCVVKRASTMGVPGLQTQGWRIKSFHHICKNVSPSLFLKSTSLENAAQRKIFSLVTYTFVTTKWSYYTYQFSIRCKKNMPPKAAAFLNRIKKFDPKKFRIQ